MPYCTLRNTSDMPVCISRPNSKEVLCILPGYTLRVRPEWDSVKQAVHQGKAAILTEIRSEETENGDVTVVI